jgi:hypothetical protein
MTIAGISFSPNIRISTCGSQGDASDRKNYGSFATRAAH